jgi:hypothetical protein
VEGIDGRQFRLRGHGGGVGSWKAGAEGGDEIGEG